MIVVFLLSSLDMKINLLLKSKQDKNVVHPLINLTNKFKTERKYLIRYVLLVGKCDESGEQWR